MSVITFLKSLARWLRRFAVLLLIIIFALVVNGLLICYSTRSVLSRTQTYEFLAAETHLAERGRDLLVELIVSTALKSHNDKFSFSSFVGEYPPQTWEGVADILLPEKWVESCYLTLVHVWLDWLNSQEVLVPQFSIDLSPVIDELRGPLGALAVLPLIQNAPVCPSDVERITILGDSLVSCLKQDQDITFISQDVARSLADILMEEVSLTSLQEAGLLSPEDIQTMIKVRAGFKVFDAAITLGARGVLVLLSLYSLIYSNSLRRLLTALPLPFYAAGLSSLLLLCIFHVFLVFGLDMSIGNIFPIIRPEMHSLLIDLIQAVGEILKPFWLFASLSLLGIALGIHGLSLVLQKTGLRKAQNLVRPNSKQPRVRRQYR